MSREGAEHTPTSDEAADGGASETPSLRDLASLVKEAREVLREPYESAAKRAGMSPMTWRRVEMDALSVRSLSYAGVEHALGWPSGSIRAYLAGGPVPRAAEPPRADDVRRHSIREFSWDELVDEMDRRYREAVMAASPPSARSGLASLETEETAESVSARGMIPGRRMNPGTGDAASGGQS